MSKDNKEAVDGFEPETKATEINYEDSPVRLNQGMLSWQNDGQRYVVSDGEYGDGGLHVYDRFGASLRPLPHHVASFRQAVEETIDQGMIEFFRENLGKETR